MSDNQNFIESLCSLYLLYHWSLANQWRCASLLFIITKPSTTKWACTDSSTLTYTVTRHTVGVFFFLKMMLFMLTGKGWWTAVKRCTCNTLCAKAPSVCGGVSWCVYSHRVLRLQRVGVSSLCHHRVAGCQHWCCEGRGCCIMDIILWIWWGYFFVDVVCVLLMVHF